MIDPSSLSSGQADIPDLSRVTYFDGERLAGFRAGDQVVEVAIGVGSPDLFDDHDARPVWPGDDLNVPPAGMRRRREPGLR